MQTSERQSKAGAPRRERDLGLADRPLGDRRLPWLVIGLLVAVGGAVLRWGF